MDEISLGTFKANNKKSSTSLIFIKNFIRIPTAVFGSIFVLLTFFSAIFAPLLVPYDPNVMDYNFLLGGMSYEHWLGTDQIGRDTLSRLIYGSRIALIVSFGSVNVPALESSPFLAT